TRPSLSRRERSTMTTASAPAGSGAPVMMRLACPAATAWRGGWPAGVPPPTGHGARPGAGAGARAAEAALTRLSEGRGAGVGGDVLGQDMPEQRRGEGERRRGQRPDLSQDQRLSVGNGKHGTDCLTPLSPGGGEGSKETLAGGVA